MKREYEIVRFSELRTEVQHSVVREWREYFLETIDTYMTTVLPERFVNLSEDMRRYYLIKGKIAVYVDYTDGYNVSVREEDYKYGEDDYVSKTIQDKGELKYGIEQLYMAHRELNALDIFKDKEATIKKCKSNRRLFVKKLISQIEDYLSEWFIMCHSDDSYLVDFLAGKISGPMTIHSDIFRLKKDGTTYEWKFGIHGETAIVPQYTTTNLTLCCYSDLRPCDRWDAIKMRKDVVNNAVWDYYKNVWQKDVLSLNGIATNVLPEGTITIDAGKKFGNIFYNFDFTKYNASWKNTDEDALIDILCSIDMDNLPFSDIIKSETRVTEDCYLPFIMKRVVDRIVNVGVEQYYNWICDEYGLEDMLASGIVTNDPDELFKDSYTIHGNTVTVPQYFDERGHIVYWRPLTTGK